MMFFLWTPDGAESRRSVTEAIVKCRKFVGDRSFANAFIRVRDADQVIALDHPKAFSEVGRVWKDAIDLASPNLMLADGAARTIPGFYLEAGVPRGNGVVTTINCLQLNVPICKLTQPGALGQATAAFRELSTLLRPHHAQAGLCMATNCDLLAKQEGRQAL